MRFILVVLILIHFNVMAFAQNEDLVAPIKPLELTVGCNKTTHLVFPFDIVSVDRGSGSIIVQKALGVNNVLQVKGDTANFNETNLSVITADGTFYSWDVQYAENPFVLSYSFFGKPGNKLHLSGGKLNKAYLDSLQLITLASGDFLNKSASEQLIKVSLGGLFLKDGLLIALLHVENSSALDYPISRIRFYTSDKKQVKRTASQEIEIESLNGAGNSGFVPGLSSINKVFIFKSFSLLNTQVLKVDCIENNGGRNVSLTIKPKFLLQARTLPKVSGN